MKFKPFILLAVLLPAGVLAAVEEDAARAVDLFYDLRFAEAIQETEAMKTRYPESPAGPFYLSVVYYQKYLLEDPPSNETFDLFQAAGQEALQKAIALTEKAPAVSQYYQGAVLGFQARVYVAQGHYRLAIPKARQGVAHLKEALALDPSLEDANLGLGLYYYFLSRVPAAAKPIAYMMVGMWGDREKGLRLIKHVMEKGHAAKSEAQSVLAAIDASQKEKKWDEAILLFGDLIKRYPHNPRYRLSLVYVLQRKGQWSPAADVADPDGTWVQELDPFVQVQAGNLARYRAAENLLFDGRLLQAGTLLDRLERDAASGSLKDWVLLRRGNYWDARGMPEKAAAAYKEIQDKKPNLLATEFLKTPFPAGPRDVMPNRWPLANIPVQ